jgi:hypothetical protein
MPRILAARIREFTSLTTFFNSAASAGSTIQVRDMWRDSRRAIADQLAAN